MPPALLPRVPTYTLPLAIVGTVNFTALPARSTLEPALFHSSRPMLVASYACSTAGPHPGDSAVQNWLLSIAQTIPFALPDAEIEGVAPWRRALTGGAATIRRAAANARDSGTPP